MNYQVMPEAGVITQRIRSKRINPVYRFPSVSIFMPFDPKMGMKNKLTFSLAKVTDKVVSELRAKYPGEMSLLVIQKLKAIIKNLDFNTHKKSLAIFVSPVFEKIYYVNIDIEEKVIVNESLQIHDLVYSKKQSRKFHILFLSEKESRIYLSDTNSSLRIEPEGLISENTCQNDVSERVANFSNSAAEEENAMEKFLHKVDRSLDIILKHERLPVFVMGTEKLVWQFRNMTKNNEAIIEYVNGDFEERSLKDLKQYVEPNTNDWQKIQQKILLLQLKDAAGKNKLVAGRKKVQHEVMNHLGGTLLMEKKFLYDTSLPQNSLLDFTVLKTFNKFSCIKNSIDEMIEKVLEDGGNVELVSNDFLQEYGQIALIKNF